MDAAVLSCGVMAGDGGSAGHAFVSYVREDSRQVDWLQAALEAAGINVWRDIDDLWPGHDWRQEIRYAIKGNALVFIACFSTNSLTRERSYQNEELNLAIDELRLRRPGVPWLIPVRFDDCEVPDLHIGAGRTLGGLQRVDLFGERAHENARRLIEVIWGLLGMRGDTALAHRGNPTADPRMRGPGRDPPALAIEMPTVEDQGGIAYTSQVFHPGMQAGSPAVGRPIRSPDTVRRLVSPGLPRGYRLGWLSLPILVFLGVASFVAPVESFWGEILGFIAALIVSRSFAAIRWVKTNGPAHFLPVARRLVLRDVIGTAGLFLIGFLALTVSTDVIMPSLGGGSMSLYHLALKVNGPHHPFSSEKQLGVFLHFVWSMPMLASASVILLRRRADLTRPLLLPRVARLINEQPTGMRLAVAVALSSATLALIWINSGLTPDRPPSGTICAVAPLSCKAAIVGFGNYFGF
jgi:hypothetical protein